MNLKLHQAMWQRQEIGRPLLGINAGFMASQRFPLLMKHVAGKAVRPEDIRVDLFLQDCDRLYETHQNLGDYPYVAAPFAGMAWLEAIMGCPFRLRIPTCGRNPAYPSGTSGTGKNPTARIRGTRN